MRWLIPWALTALLTTPAAQASDRAVPAAEVVVTVSAEATLVGVGEPPNSDRLGALVYLADVTDTAAAVREMAAALGGAAGVRRYATATATDDALQAADAAIRATGLPLSTVAPEAADPGAHMTVDAGGYHRRDALGDAATAPGAAVETFAAVSSYGHGHAEPMFEPLPGGGMRQVRAEGWDQPTRSYACPFPATPGLDAPVGMALEITVGDGRSASEEALASWCDHVATALASSCPAADTLDAFATGPVEVVFGDPPGPGLWWLLPLSAAPAGGSSVPVDCAAEALATLPIAATHAGLTLRFTLVEGDLTEGCRRVVEESCK